MNLKQIGDFRGCSHYVNWCM